MIRFFRITLIAMTFLNTGIVLAQNGVVFYSLPSTTVGLTVEAQKETFTAGPYAKYAAKYLGADARMNDEVVYSLQSIKLVPYIEADPSSRIALNLAGKNVPSANFLQFCSQGLIVMSDSYTGKSEAWRFPSIAGNDPFAGKDIDGNLTSATTTLYKTVKTAEGLKKTSVSQTQVVEKSLEKKAQETANAIFNLRKKRVEIITGDTDATFSGEALGAAVAEINRLEAEYLSLFYGVSDYSSQTMSFDVTPKADNARQMYVAFRISDTEGLLPANAVAGRPVILELIVEEPVNNEENTGKHKRNGSSDLQYRVPVTAIARIVDAGAVLMQARIPVYQLGKTETFPLNSIIK